MAQLVLVIYHKLGPASDGERETSFYCFMSEDRGLNCQPQSEHFETRVVTF